MNMAAQPGGALIHWGRERFVRHDHSTEPCPAEVDVSGRIRNLIFGPMEGVPAGRWRLTVRLHISDAAARVPYNLQFIFGHGVTERPFQVFGGGTFDVSLENQSDIDAPVALRLWNSRPAFSGAIRFEYATLELL